MTIQEKLFALQDRTYKKFHSKLMPTIDDATIIGVRVPALRMLAKELIQEDCISDFIQELPHAYYEENNLHAFIIQYKKDFNECCDLLEKFLPYIDNWATCDMLRPASLKKHKKELYTLVQKWIASDKVYTVRFAIGMLQSFFLDESFDEKHLELVAQVQLEDYYVQMMIAWYFATALTKQYEKTICYIEQQKLPQWIHNKTIQKAIESYRIPSDRKVYLKQFKIKNVF